MTYGVHYPLRISLVVVLARLMQRRADALYSRAGSDYGEGFVVKHKWMRWRTFNRLMDRANLLSQYADAAFLYRMRRFGFASLDDLAEFALSNAPEERRAGFIDMDRFKPSGPCTSCQKFGAFGFVKDREPCR
jgi:hypothetical protein